MTKIQKRLLSEAAVPGGHRHLDGHNADIHHLVRRGFLLSEDRLTKMSNGALVPMPHISLTEKGRAFLDTLS